MSLMCLRPVKLALIQWCSPQSHDRISRFGLDDDFPAIANEHDLKRNVGLFAINVHQLNADGVPYLGYEFGCEWDREHGAGVLMHGTTAVEVGLADTALLLWLAERDAEQKR
jgi:hypothetical protein